MNFFEEFKEYKIVNGQLVEDIDVKTTKNDKQQLTTGHVNNTPIYIKKRFHSTLKRSSGVGKRKNKPRKTRKTRQPVRKYSYKHKKRDG
jgi:hypothetical protein